MFGNFRYITSILLLVIFPLSAIGLNVSVRNCGHSGMSSIVLFNSAPGNGKKMSCCCQHKSKTEAVRPKNNVQSSCSSKNMAMAGHTAPAINAEKSRSGKTHSCCQNKEKKVKKSSCCLSRHEDKGMTGLHGAVGKVPANKQASIKLSGAPCCSFSSISLQVEVVSACPEKSGKNLKFQALIPLANPEISNKKLCQARPDKILNYPLKEPIHKIISFIYLCSSSNDEPDEAFSHYC